MFGYLIINNVRKNIMHSNFKQLPNQLLVAFFDIAKTINLAMLDNVCKISKLLEFDTDETSKFNELLNKLVETSKLFEGCKEAFINLILTSTTDDNTNEKLYKINDFFEEHNIVLPSNDNIIQSIEFWDVITTKQEKLQKNLNDGNNDAHKETMDLSLDITIDILKKFNNHYPAYSIATLLNIYQRSIVFLAKSIEDSSCTEIIEDETNGYINKLANHATNNLDNSEMFGMLDQNLADETLAKLEQNINVLKAQNTSNLFRSPGTNPDTNDLSSSHSMSV